MKWLVLVLGIISNASASVLIKIALSPQRRIPSISDPWAIFMNGPLMAGLALYGTAFLLYAITLKFLPLNIAHPTLTSGAIAFVSLMSVVLLGESLRPAMIAGLAFIVFGVILLTAGAR